MITIIDFSNLDSVKQKNKLRQPLGNFILNIAEFLEEKNFKLVHEDQIKTKRIPNKAIPIFLQQLKEQISIYAFNVLLNIESNSHFLTTNSQTYIFDLERCCNFKKIYGLPCIHFFYNNKTISAD